MRDIDILEKDLLNVKKLLRVHTHARVAEMMGVRKSAISYFTRKYHIGRTLGRPLLSKTKFPRKPKSENELRTYTPSVLSRWVLGHKWDKRLKLEG